MRGDVRLIGVVLGAANGGERDLHMASLLDQGFVRMGVPIEMERREPPGFRVPFIGTASAAPYGRSAPVQVAEAPKGWRYRSARAAVELRAVPVRRQAEPRWLRPRQIGSEAAPIVAQPVSPRSAMARERSMPPAYAAHPGGTRTAHRAGAWRSPG